MCGSRRVRSWRVSSGRSIAMKRRLVIRKQTSNSDNSRASARHSIRFGHDQRSRLQRLAFGFVVARDRFVSRPRYPIGDQTAQFGTGARSVPLSTGRLRQEPVCQLHGVTGEIRKQGVSNDLKSRRKCKRQRRLTATAGSENFSRSAIGIHGEKRRSGGSSEPGKLVVMSAFELCVHVRAGAHHSRRDRCHVDIVARKLSSKRVRKTSQRKFACAVARQMRHSNLAANGKNIDYASADLAA